MLKHNETLECVGEAVTKEVYRIYVGSHFYEGNRVWSIYEGNTLKDIAKTYEDALNKANIMIENLHGKEIIHNHD